MSDIVLEAVPLTAAVFAPFGDVIETAGMRRASSMRARRSALMIWRRWTFWRTAGGR